MVVAIPMIVAAMMTTATQQPQQQQQQPLKLSIPRGEIPTKVEPYRPLQTTPQPKG